MKTVKIITISLIISLLILGGWWFGFRTKTNLSNLPQAIQSFFPLGITNQVTNTIKDAVTDSLTGADEEDRPTTRILFDRPIGSFTTTSLASSTLVFFTDQAKGNLYVWNSSNNQTKRLSNDTTLNTRSLTTLTDANFTNVYLKSTTDSKEIQYKVFSIPTEILLTDNLDTNFQPKNLPNNIKDIITNYNDLLVIETSGSGVAGYTSSPDLNNKLKKFSSILTSFNFSLTKNNNIVLNTKPSYFTDGFSFILKDGAKALDYLVVNKSGLNTNFSPNEQMVIYSTSNGTKINTFLYDLVNNQTTSLPFDTLAEKCTWSTDSASVYCGLPINYPDTTYNFPDDWYSGLVNFNDNIIGFNVTDPRTFYTIFNLQSNKIDIKKIELSTNDRLLFYQDKNTNNLWLSELTY